MVARQSAPASSGIGHGQLFWLALVFTVALMVVLGVVVDAPLKTSAARMGIISYELAGTPIGAQAILDSWNPLARAYAGFSLGLDYLYMPSYALTIGLACAWAARRLRVGWPWVGVLGFTLAWSQALAMLCDATENVALTRMLLVAVAEPWPAIARWCATIKFALIVAGLLYSLTGLIFWLASRRANRVPPQDTK